VGARVKDNMNDVTPPTQDAPPAAAPSAPAPLRVCITGSPRAGKTEASERRAAEMGVTARHTDDARQLVEHLPEKERWSAASAVVATWLEDPGPWLIEGVALPRALRKWLQAHAGDSAKPCDVLILHEQPVMELTRGQETMRKGIVTVWGEIRAELEARGVEIRAAEPR
jgi:hypothetical protein